MRNRIILISTKCYLTTVFTAPPSFAIYSWNDWTGSMWRIMKSSSNLYLGAIFSKRNFITLYLWRVLLGIRMDISSLSSLRSINPLNGQWAAALARFTLKLWQCCLTSLNRCMNAVATLFNEDFYDGRMQAVWRVRWRCTSFYVVHACLVYDDERTFKSVPCCRWILGSTFSGITIISRLLCY